MIILVEINFLMLMPQYISVLAICYSVLSFQYSDF